MHVSFLKGQANKGRSARVMQIVSGWSFLASCWFVCCCSSQTCPSLQAFVCQHGAYLTKACVWCGCLLQALCFDCEEDMVELVGKDPSKFKGKVIVIRSVRCSSGSSRGQCSRRVHKKMDGWPAGSRHHPVLNQLDVFLFLHCCDAQGVFMHELEKYYWFHL
jgi:hypothetical protein